ncbi:MAG: NAD(P)-dependent oxidoreductase [Magnetococcales bacterium]|nr:NAD(P)-dependent oxidoreductase [Magnetococcales bacterium]
MAAIAMTGAEGFIGSCLAPALVASGHRVRGVDIVPRRRFLADAPFLQGNLADPAFARSVVEGMDGVIHLAGVSRAGAGKADPVGCAIANVTASVTLFQAIRQQNRQVWLLLGSTREVDSLKNKTMPDSLADFYAISKRSMEEMAISFARECHLKLIIMRLSDVYGHGQDHPDKLLPLFLRLAQAGKPLQVRDGNSRFHYTHIDDVVRAFVEGVSTLSTSTHRLEVRRLWTDHSVTIQELAQLVCRTTRSVSPIDVMTPGTVGVGSREPTPEMIDSWRFQPQVTLEEGVEGLSGSCSAR